jgi:5'-3' exonuclease
MAHFTLIDISSLRYATYFGFLKRGFRAGDAVLQAKRSLINAIIPAIQIGYKPILVFDKKDETRNYWRQHFIEMQYEEHCAKFPENHSNHNYKEPKTKRVVDLGVMSIVKQAAEELKGSFNYFETPGLEADDIIAIICKYKKDETKIDIFTGDRDLAGLVNDTTGIRWINAQNPGRYNIETESAAVAYFQRKVNQRVNHPSEVYNFKAKAGDSSDNLPRNCSIELVDLINYAAPKAFGFESTHTEIKNYMEKN